MSHHGITYRIMPDDESKLSKEAWSRADRFIGLEHRRDFKEACALAKWAAKSTQYPFIVMAIPMGGVKPKLCDCWVAGEEYEAFAEIRA